MVDARKEPIGRKSALTLARGMRRVVAAKGKRVVTFDMQKDPPGDAALAEAIIGPTGNLRAPALKVGTTLIVGFHEEEYDRLLA